jgi:hypothetical protein
VQQAFAERDVHMTFLLDHKWNALRPNPRFAALVDRCNLTSAYAAEADRGQAKAHQLLDKSDARNSVPFRES